MVDFVSVVLLFTAAILWIDFVIRMANPFDIKLRQDRTHLVTPTLPDLSGRLPMAAFSCDRHRISRLHPVVHLG